MVALSSAMPGDRSNRARRVTVVLLLFLTLTAVLSIQTGAAGVSPVAVLKGWLGGHGISARDQVVLMNIRLPRLCLAMLVGAALAVSGAVMQGLFRNPLADPGIVGVGAGASLGAVLAIVLGGMLPLWITGPAGGHLVGFMAFAGGAGVTFLLYYVATRQGRTSVATMLLAGIAIAALTGAVMGILIFMADDRQLRDLTFWGLGSLGGASWTKVGVALPLITLALATAPVLARGLNALALGEAAAAHMGQPVQRLKRTAIVIVAAATGASVAVAGGIGFIGLVVPHLLRLATGPDHRWLLPNAALLGAALLTLADIVARTIVSPAELPIGIVTAVLGAPVFLWILLRQRGIVDL